MSDAYWLGAPVYRAADPAAGEALVQRARDNAETCWIEAPRALLTARGTRITARFGYVAGDWRVLAREEAPGVWKVCWLDRDRPPVWVTAGVVPVGARLAPRWRFGTRAAEEEAWT